MNHVFFACRTCKAYIDAGYRWAAWTLEQPGVVRRGERVRVPDVLGSNDYWAGGSNDEVLARRLPRIRDFLMTHTLHDVIFDEDESFRQIDDDGAFLDWLEDDAEAAELSPRYFVERLGLANWDAVVTYVEQQSRPPWWWDIPAYHDLARAKFDRLIRS